MQPLLRKISMHSFLWLLGLIVINTPIFSQTASEHRMKLWKLWEYKSNGAIDLAPTIRNDIVLVLPAKQALLAFNKITGQLLWQFKPKAGLWSRSITADTNTVYVATQNAKLVAIDIRSGIPRWEVNLEYQLQVRPLIHRNKVYVATTQIGPGLPMQPERKARLLAFDAEDGTLLWSHKTLYYAMQTPAVYKDHLYTSGSYYDPKQDIDEGGPMAIQSRSIKDGSVNWTKYGEAGFVKTVYATENRVAYVGYQDFVNGLDSKTGEKIWKKDTGNWVPALTGNEEMLYYGSANTIVHAHLMENGERVWEYNIPWGSFNYILGEPIVDNNRLIFLTQRGYVVALSTLTGSKIWSAETDMQARTGLAFSGDIIVIGDDKGKIRGYRILSN